MKKNISQAEYPSIFHKEILDIWLYCAKVDWRIVLTQVIELDIEGLTLKDKLIKRI